MEPSSNAKTGWGEAPAEPTQRNLKRCLLLSGTTLVLLLALLGCSSTGPKAEAPSSRSGDIIQLNVMTAPVGLNLDERPGPDGFSAKVFAVSEGNPKPIAIRSGTLEILMFDGSFYGRTNVPPPLRIWTFTAEELVPHERKAGIGIGYDFLLPWGTAHPTQKLISVAARYTSASGKIVTSRPSSVSVIDH